MKKLVLPLLIGLLAVTGCRHSYVLKLSNGSQLTTASKPHLKNGNYYYKDASGREQYVSQGRVREVVPASQAGEEKTMFRPSPSH